MACFLQTLLYRNFFLLFASYFLKKFYYRKNERKLPSTSPKRMKTLKKSCPIFCLFLPWHALALPCFFRSLTTLISRKCRENPTSKVRTKTPTLQICNLTFRYPNSAIFNSGFRIQIDSLNQLQAISCEI